MTSDAPLLKMQGVRKQFGATRALDGVDLEVYRGQVLALVGENGAGKSTLMKVLSGAHQADEGQMWLEGTPYTPHNPLDARRAGVAMIYQELSLAPHLSVAENILLGAEPQKGPVLDRRQIAQRARDALIQVGQGQLPLNVPVSRLSVAEGQLVEIARAIALDSRVLVFDEPTSSLTQSDIARLFTLVRNLKAQGRGIVYISHFLEEVQALSDRFTVLRDGRSVGGGITHQTSNDRIISMMVGRDVKDLYPRSPREPGEVVLRVNQLGGPSKGQGAQLNSATLELRRGEVLGIAGLVGAGRTELLRAIFGLDTVKSGEVTLSSNRPDLSTQFSGKSSPAQRWSRGIGMVSEDRKLEGLALNLSIEENLTLPKLPQVFTPSALGRTAIHWSDRLRVKRHSTSQAIGGLSGGNQQKVAIARLLYSESDVLLLDEPTRGIDVGSKAGIYQTIDELASEGKAVLMVSSYLPELLGTCDRIAVMCRGVLSPAWPVGELDEHKIMLAATGTETPTNPDEVAETPALSVAL